jgi:putative colanic acid biosynthesis acetyltransferase WcaF
VPAHAWRRFVLRLFGAKIAARCAIYPSARIWAPWNLELETAVTIGPGTTIYNVALICLGEHAIVSQGAHLCAATHDFRGDDFALMVGPIHVGPHAWIAAEAFISPGVTIGHAAVVGARTVVTKPVSDFAIIAGNPAKTIGQRPETARNNLGL